MTGVEFVDPPATGSKYDPTFSELAKKKNRGQWVKLDVVRYHGGLVSRLKAKAYRGMHGIEGQVETKTHRRADGLTEVFMRVVDKEQS